MNIKVTGWTRLGIDPGSTAPKADAVSTRPSELLAFPRLEDENEINQLRYFKGLF